MANEFSTAGVVVKYCCESTAGTRPETGYTTLPGIKSTPEFKSEPSQLEVTDLSDTTYKRYIPGLIDTSGSATFTANLTTAFKTAWATLVSAADTAYKAGKATWFEIAIPNFDSFYFSGLPSELGLNSLETDSVAEVDAYVITNAIEGWATAST